MEYTHEFATKAAFIEQYLGENYKTHWVSLTTSDNNVNYDKDLEELPLITYPTVAGASTFTMSIPAGVTTDYLTSISYSIDGGATWTTTNNSSSAVTITVTLSEQKFVLWKGVGNATGVSTSVYTKLTCNKNWTVLGNPLSLIGKENSYKDLSKNPYTFFGLFYGSSTLINADKLKLTADILGNYSYAYMFYNCTNLETYPILPATTLGQYCYSYMFSKCTKMITPPALNALKLDIGCYHYMFSECSALTSVPSLPSTNVARNCYERMFYKCTGLTNPTIVLPATTLAQSCYLNMFNSCNNLTVVPTLPATGIAPYCYGGMFAGCSKLNTVPLLPATKLEDYCYYYMFQNCTSLTSGPVLPATILSDFCYQYMFSGCSKLTSAPALPATSIPGSAYYGMFQSCTALTTMPDLPATTFTGSSVYRQMFQGCTSLSNVVKVLPATTLSQTYVYYQMFINCTSITTAPSLPAKTTTNYCYYQMFSGCTSLNEITVLFETNPATSNNTTGWMTDVAASGIFNMSSTAAWDPDSYRGVNGVPTNWTVNTITPTLVTRDGETSYIVPNNGLTIGLGGYDLLQNPTITISDLDEVFTIELDEDSDNNWDDWSSLSPPYPKGNLYVVSCSDYETQHTATITLSSPGATNLVVTITNLQLA